MRFCINRRVLAATIDSKTVFTDLALKSERVKTERKLTEHSDIALQLG